MKSRDAWNLHHLVRLSVQHDTLMAGPAIRIPTTTFKFNSFLVVNPCSKLLKEHGFLKENGDFERKMRTLNYGLLVVEFMAFHREMFYYYEPRSICGQMDVILCK